MPAPKAKDAKPGRDRKPKAPSSYKYIHLKGDVYKELEALREKDAVEVGFELSWSKFFSRWIQKVREKEAAR